MKTPGTQEAGVDKDRAELGKQVEDLVAEAFSQRTRAYVITVLNEGLCTIAEIAAIIREPQSNVKYHVRKLLEDKRIEVGKEERVGNTYRYYYRLVDKPYYSEEEFAAMTLKERQELVGLTIQRSLAEVMSAFWAGKMSDPRVFLSWSWFNVDEQGRREITEELRSSWERVERIEAESINRCALTGEPTRSFVVSSAGFLRERTSQQPPAGLGSRSSK